jgi:hypothetical protein
MFQMIVRRGLGRASEHIPLSEKSVQAIGAALIPLAFDRVYSHHFERVIDLGGPNRVQHQGERRSADDGRRLREEHRMDQMGWHASGLR